MLIDFHTHAFPDKIANRAMQSLMSGTQKTWGFTLHPCTDGTFESLKAHADICGVDRCVVLPIATKVGQDKSINAFARQVTDDKIYSFASVHPMQPNLADALKSVADEGFVGIKLHPDFQDFYIDSKESIKLLKLCEDLGLYTVIHAGKDAGFIAPVHATPERIKNTLCEISGEKLICAHLGGWMMWDDVEKYLVGTPVIFDTAYTEGCLDGEQALRIIRNHGACKVVFGSDAPWQSPRVTLRFLESIGLTTDELELIKYKNALKILGVK